LTAPSMPEPDPAARAAVGRALTQTADAVVGEVPPPWRQYLRGQVGQAGDEVTAETQDAISGVLARTPDRRNGRPPSWSGLVGTLQWLLLAVLVVGLLWVAAIVLLRYLGVGPVWTPQVGPVPAEPPWPAPPAIPWPEVLLAGAVTLGELQALAATVAGAAGDALAGGAARRGGAARGGAGPGGRGGRPGGGGTPAAAHPPADHRGDRGSGRRLGAGPAGRPHRGCTRVRAGDRARRE